jgi:hypothetical protein
MDVDAFIDQVGSLSTAELTAIAAAIAVDLSSAAGEVAWWHAAVELDRQLRQSRRRRQANLAGCRASRAVQKAAGDGGLDLPDARVTVVARAAYDVARAAVAGRDDVVADLVSSWPVPAIAPLLEPTPPGSVLARPAGPADGQLVASP